MGLNAKESLTEMNKFRHLSNHIRITMFSLEAVELEEATEEAGRQRSETSLNKMSK